MFKEEVAVLKEHIHIKRRQVNAYREMKKSLTNDDLMVQVDFAESYKDEHQNAILSDYFGNQCFSTFTACCYSKVSEKTKNDNVIIVTERSEHDRVASMSCLQKVVQEIESKYSKSYKNLYVWSDGMGAQFRFHLFSSCWRVLYYPISHSRGFIMNGTMGRVPWMVSEGP